MTIPERLQPAGLRRHRRPDRRLVPDVALLRVLLRVLHQDDLHGGRLRHGHPHLRHHHVGQVQRPGVPTLQARIFTIDLYSLGRPN